MIQKFLFILCIALSSLGHTEIQETSSLKPIQKELENSPKETLVLIDIGDTLLTYSDVCLLPSYESWRRGWFQTHCPHMTKEDKALWVQIITKKVGSRTLTDRAWPQLIQEAQKQGKKVVAFTSESLDPLLHDERAKQLTAYQIIFNDELPELSKGSCYTYVQGYVKTDVPLKGQALKEVLSQLSMQPKKIIFVDDQKKQITSVEETCQALQIPSTSFYYIRSKTSPPLDEKLADYQFSTLVSEHRWLSDTEASVELEKRLIPFPHFPNKASYQSLHTPQGRLEYNKKAGKYPTYLAPRTLIICYNEGMKQYLLQKYRHQPCDGCFSDVIYLLDYPGVAIACFGIGAPINAMRIDEAIEWGVKRFISIGSACPLQKGASFGDIIVCERAIRDEGTSHHYLPYAKYAYASKELTDACIKTLQSMNETYRVGTTLTSDAFYKISKEEVEFFQKEGVQCMEMEAAAEFAAVSLHKDVQIAAIFTFYSDSYANLTWERPVFDKEKKKEAFEKLLQVALKVSNS